MLINKGTNTAVVLHIGGIGYCRRAVTPLVLLASAELRSEVMLKACNSISVRINNIGRCNSIRRIVYSYTVYAKQTKLGYNARSVNRRGYTHLEASEI